MALINIYMFGIALAGSLIYYLQAYKIFTTRSAQDISLAGFSINLFTSINWLVYGLFKTDIPLIFSGLLGVVGAGSVLLGIFFYKNPNNTE